MVKVKGQGRWRVDDELGGEVVGVVSELNSEPTIRLVFLLGLGLQLWITG